MLIYKNINIYVRTGLSSETDWIREIKKRYKKDSRTITFRENVDSNQYKVLLIGFYQSISKCPHDFFSDPVKIFYVRIYINIFKHI